MSKPPFLRVVGKDAEPDDGNDEATIAKVTAAIRGVMKDGGLFWLVAMTPDSLGVVCSQNQLEASAYAEEIARDHKLTALGME
jgi:hypothetical protein